MWNSLRINDRCAVIAEKIVAIRYAILIFFVALAAFALAGLPRLQVDTSQESWFLEGDAALEAKKRFEDIFGNEDMASVLVTADNIFTAENLRLIRELGDELKARVPYADDVRSIADFEFTLGVPGGMEIIELVPEDLSLLPSDAVGLARIKALALSKPALKNRFVSEDGREAWVVLRLKPIPKEPDENGLSQEIRLGRAFFKVIQQDKYRELNPKASGMQVVDVEKRDFLAKEAPRLIGICLAIMALVLGCALRCVQGVLFPLVTAMGSIIIVLGLQGHFRISMDPSMLFLPIFLSLTMATCYSIHVFNFFLLEFARSGNRKHSIQYALAETAWPQFFSSLTTVVALLSFYVIPLRPIRWVGLTAAALVAVTWLLATLLLPALLSFGKDKKAECAEKAWRGTLLDKLMDYCGTHVLNRPRLSVGIFVIFLIACSVAASRVEVSFDIRRSFGPGVPYVKRLMEIGDSVVGSLYSYGVAIEFPEADMAKNPDTLKKLDMLGQEILDFPLTKKISSVTDIIKDLNQVVSDGDPGAYRLPDTREEVAQLLLLYENAGGSEAEKWIDYDYQRLRLQVEISDYNSGEIMRQLEIVRERCAELFPGARVIMTGALCQFTVMMDYITWGQINSNGLALLTVIAFMAVAFGSVRTGLIAMIPNVVPGFVVAAVMGLFSIPLDVMTVTIVPMLLGLAVNDTIHFINHCKLEFARTGNYRESVHRSFKTVGKALFLTSVILVLGFGSYLTSPVKVFSHMAWLIAAGVLIAMISDCFITPVLISKLRTFGPETLPNPAPQKRPVRTRSK